MDERFPLEGIPKEVADIAARLRVAGHEAWYVGGAVRDALIRDQLGLDVPQGDFDIATSARPEQVVRIFKRTVPVGIEHGTVAVLDSANRGHEVTTFRKDVKTDGRHAEVAFGVSLDDDLERRDFTINAIAVHPESGALYDPKAGRADLTARVIRAVGDPAMRFREDRLRVLRGLRFAAAFGFSIEPGTSDALRASAGELEYLSRERVRDEWLKMLSSSPPARALALWRGAGVLNAVWPELGELDAQDLADLDAIDEGDAVLTTAAIMTRGKVPAPRAAGALSRLRFSNRDASRIEGILRALADGLPDAADAAALRRWMARHRGTVMDAAKVAPGDAGLRERLVGAVLAVEASRAALSVGELAISGNDLAVAGIPLGPGMGQTLRRLLEAVLDEPDLNTREALLALAREKGPQG